MKTTQVHQVGAVVLCAVTVLLFQRAPALQTLPFYDSLNYVEGARLGAATGGGSIWTYGNSTGTGSMEVRAEATLTYPDLVTSGGLGVWATGVPTSNRDRGVPFTEQVFDAGNTTVYASFLLNIQTGPTANDRLLAGFRAGTGTAGGFTPTIGIFLDPSLQLRISKNSYTPSATTSSALALNTTNLVVVRYTWNSGADNDQVALWFNPGSAHLGVGEGNVPAPAILTTTGTDSASLGSFHFTLRVAAAQNGGGTYWLDEPRVGKTWASVTPPIPEPATWSLLVLGGLGLSVWRLRRSWK